MFRCGLGCGNFVCFNIIFGLVESLQSVCLRCVIAFVERLLKTKTGMYFVYTVLFVEAIKKIVLFSNE